MSTLKNFIDIYFCNFFGQMILDDEFMFIKYY